MPIQWWQGPCPGEEPRWVLGSKGERRRSQLCPRRWGVQHLAVYCVPGVGASWAEWGAGAQRKQSQEEQRDREG